MEDELESRGLGDAVRRGGDFARGDGDAGRGGTARGKVGSALGDVDAGKVACVGEFADDCLGMASWTVGNENELWRSSAGPESNPENASSKVGFGDSDFAGAAFTEKGAGSSWAVADEMTGAPLRAGVIKTLSKPLFLLPVVALVGVGGKGVSDALGKSKLSSKAESNANCWVVTGEALFGIAPMASSNALTPAMAGV